MTLLEAIGWTGNACFFARWIVQWLASERAKMSAAPRSFFLLSLAGGAASFAYTLSRGELILLGSTAANLVIHARNLALHRAGARQTAARVGGAFLVLCVVLAAGVASDSNQAETGAWLAVGVLGQTATGSRFALQWWISERRGVVHFPRVFWWLSLVGSALVLAYSIHTGDPIWIVGNVTAWIVPIRNLLLSCEQDAQAVSA